MSQRPQCNGDMQLVRQAAVIAAGHGERLRRGGVVLPKPLVPIGGMPMIERTLRAIAAQDISVVACIFNAETASDSIEAHCRRAVPQLDLRVVRRTTPNSMESLFSLAPLLADDPFLLLTVDAIFDPSVLPALIRHAVHHPDADGLLAVHDFIDDEKPLYVCADAQHRITAIGTRGGPLISAGLYVFSPRIFAEIDAARSAGCSALRDFLSHLCKQRYRLFAVRVPATIDVDRPEDIAVAEQFLAMYASPPSGLVASLEGAGPSAPYPNHETVHGAHGGAPSNRRGRGEGAPRHRVLAIGREPVYSPGKVEADRSVLEAVAARLIATHDVRIVDGIDPLPARTPADIVLTMAQGPDALETLVSWQSQGVRIINAPAAIRGCHRSRMTLTLASVGVPQPESVVLAADDDVPDWVTSGAWLKRGDVHATQPDDVVYVDNRPDALAALAGLQRRGITTGVLQRHVDGRVIKFYAVRDSFFAWFSAHGSPLELPATLLAEMRCIADRAAAALGLEIFGGDCVAHASIGIQLIDLNDWPSYAPCRAEAAHAIAEYVIKQETSR